MTIAVTGATGALGSLAIDALLRKVPAGEVIAVVRDPAKAASVADRSIAVRVAAYDDLDALTAAFAGVSGLLFVSGNEVGQRVAQHTNVINAAKAAGVAHVVYTSAPRADNTPLSLAVEHNATEVALKASGLTYTILRNNWYHENYVGQLEAVGASGVLLGSTHGGTVASASRADYAEAAAVVLTEGGHDNKTYELGGDVAWDSDTLAAAFAEVTGKPVAYRDVSTEEHVAALREHGLDAGTAQFVAGLDSATAAGALGDVTGELRRLIGRPTTPLVDGLRG
jgi:NAD(P)H dehydrogenase (quinone)